MIILEHPGNKLSNGMIKRIRKELKITEPMSEICSARRYYQIFRQFEKQELKRRALINEHISKWETEHGCEIPPWELNKLPKAKSKTELKRDVNAFLEKERDNYAPYKAIMFVKESQDESSYAERLTDDSIIILSSFDSIDFSYFRTMSPIEYIKWCETKRTEDLADFSSDDEYLLDLDIKQAEFDYGTGFINLNQPDTIDKIERILTPHYYPRSFTTNANHFDNDKIGQEKVIEGKFFSTKEKAKLMKANHTKEELDFLSKRFSDLMEWLITLPENERTTVLSWYKQPNLKICDCCGHKYSNDRTKCPVCLSDNEDYQGDLADRNPDWFDQDGKWWGNPDYENNYKGEF